MKVQPVGTIMLPVVVGSYPQQIAKELNFLVVNCSSSYNAIIGRPTLNRWKVVTSTYHLSVKFPTEYGVGQVQGDQLAARECYLAMLSVDEYMQTMNIEERRVAAEPTKVLEDIPLEEGNPEKFTRIGTSMKEKMKKDLVQFLRKRIDVFAWSHEDMPVIDPSVITHRLNVHPSSKPVRQKKRVFALERDNAIKEEVQKLTTTQFIREVYYPDWLANVVMVKKANGKWRIYVDFTDLNKACPKDSYPLPHIDQLVDSTAGHRLLSFMDAFSGYNQIKMDEADQEKTSIITSQGLFCYKIMHFGLKNARATYQRLVNHMFTDLNKTCPKDSYPMPHIDQLVCSTAGHQLLSFMDAFSGYNQIKMEEVDQEKTSFITSYESSFFFSTQAQGSWAKQLQFSGLGLVHRS